MRILSVLLLSLVSMSVAQAAPKINKGDWQVGGAFNLSYSSGSYSNKTRLSLSADGQYFFADGFSAGLNTSYAYFGSSHFGVAPVFTKYFLVKDQLAPYVSVLPISWSAVGNLNLSSSSARVGMKYFLTDSVSFGPALDYTHYWGNKYWVSKDNVSLLGLFSIHL